MIHVASIHSNAAGLTKVLQCQQQNDFCTFFHKTFQCNNSKVLQKPPFAAMNS